MGGVAAPIFELGSNVAVLLNIEDNQAPHPTISHLETDCRNSTATPFAGK